MTITRMAKKRARQAAVRVSARELRAAVGAQRPRRVPVQVAVPEESYLRLLALADAEGVAVGRVILRLALSALPAPQGHAPAGASS